MDKLRARLILSHLLPVLVMTPLVGLALIYVLETQVVLTNLSIGLTRQAVLLAEIAQDYPDIWEDPDAARAFVVRFRDPLTAQMMLVDASGRLLAASDPTDARLVTQRLLLPGLPEVQSGEVDVQIDYSQDLQADVVDVLAPAFAGPRVVGAVRLTYILATVRERFLRLRYLILYVLTGALGLGLVVGLFLALTLERPLVNLTQAIHRLVEGEQLALLAERGPAEMRLLVRAFNTLVERLRTLETARRRLLANLVHELRRPLGALRSAVYALLNGASDEVELRDELLTGIDEELKRLQRMLDDLSALYEQALGRLELQPQTTDFSEWLATVVSPWREAAQHKGLAWQVELPTPGPAVPIDPDRLAQAVGNLLSNAIKYTPPGGAVAVKAGVSDENVLITVSDTGPGIPPEEQHQIFEPFARSRDRQRAIQGLGLGLAIARDLVVAHGGRLEVASAPGAGSHFTIRLPHPNRNEG
jgi:two-component system, OmpR family, sensor histidine kinase BaeS